MREVGAYVNTVAEGSPLAGIYDRVLAGDSDSVTKLVDIGYQVLILPAVVREQIAFEERQGRRPELTALYKATGRFAAANGINPRVTHRR